MPPMKPKTPSFLAELAQLAGNLKDLPYTNLARALADAGWISLLAQTDVTPSPSGTVLVTFDVMVGKSYESLERLDAITVTMPPNPGPVSVAARISARDSVLFLMTGRLPPRPEAAAPPPAAGQMNGGDETHRVDMADADVELPGEDKPTVRVVERREPDGLPIFRDLDAIPEAEADTADIIDTVMAEVRQFIGGASAEQVDALLIKNPEMATFVKDLGRPTDWEEFKALGMRRKAELSTPAMTPRRRQPVGARSN